MSKLTNRITKYFRKEKIIDDAEERDKMSRELSSIDECDHQPLSPKRVRSNDSSHSTTSSIITTVPVSTNCSSISESTICSSSFSDTVHFSVLVRGHNEQLTSNNKGNFLELLDS